MLSRKLLIGSLFALSVSAALPAAARSNVDLYLDFGPPPARVEYVPAPRAGWVWVPGFWGWRGHHHVWFRGHWEQARPGYYYAPSRWVPYGDRWGYHRGGWRRDSDGDGVPDRFDARPFNPYVR